MSSWLAICDPLPEHALPDSLPALALFPLTQLGVVRLSGPDTRAFLHGQLTADINALSREQATLAAQCDPKGKMLGLFTLCWQADDALLIEHRSAISEQMPALAKYAVFSKTEISDDSDNLLLLGIAGEQGPQALRDAGLTVPANDYQASQLDGGVLLRLPGQRLLVALPAAAMATLTARLDGQWLAASAWTALEITHGIPQLAAPLSGQYIPQQLNLDKLGAINFEKGCYIGQEVVARMHFRGGNKRALWQLHGQASQVPDAGDTLELKLGDSYRRGGVVVSAASQADGQLLVLAVAANDLDADSHFRLAADPDSELTLR